MGTTTTTASDFGAAKPLSLEDMRRAINELSDTCLRDTGSIASSISFKDDLEFGKVQQSLLSDFNLTKRSESPTLMSLYGLRILIDESVESGYAELKNSKGELIDKFKIFK